jgi:hypothetical protein
LRSILSFSGMPHQYQGHIGYGGQHQMWNYYNTQYSLQQQQQQQQHPQQHPLEPGFQPGVNDIKLFFLRHWCSNKLVFVFAKSLGRARSLHSGCSTLLTNIRLSCKRLTRDKQSSLFVRSISDEEKRFYDMNTRNGYEHGQCWNVSKSQ